MVSFVLEVSRSLTTRINPSLSSQESECKQEWNGEWILQSESDLEKMWLAPANVRQTPQTEKIDIKNWQQKWVKKSTQQSFQQINVFRELYASILSEATGQQHDYVGCPKT